jgi:hypothetical protein
MSINITIADVPEEREVQSSLAPILEEAQYLVVETLAQHEIALNCIKRCSATEKQVHDLFRKPKTDANRAHKSIVAAEKTLLAPLLEAKGVLNTKCTAYEQEQERVRRDEQRLLEEKARREEEDRLLQDAMQAQEAGDAELAEQIINEEIETPVVKVEANTAHVEGVSSRELWSAEVTNKAALLRFVLEHPEMLNLIEPNMPALNGLARSMRREFKIPGVRAISKTTRAVRS